jgi:serine/threonine-protein kinase
VKPGNLLVRDEGRLSVTDFGIAYAAGTAALTRTGQVVGTASYLSPEQASGRPVTPATDLYALGVVAFECLSGRRPFERDDPVAVLLAHLQTPPPPLPDDVPRPVADLVDRLLAKDPADRPSSASQVQREAASLRRDLPAALAPTAVLPSAPPAAAAAGAAAPPTGGPRTAVLGLAGRPGQRRAVRVTAVALGLLALALGVRDALVDDPSASDVRQPRPTSSVPAQTGPAQTGPAQTAPAEPVPGPPEPTQEAPAAEPQGSSRARAREAAG